MSTTHDIQRIIRTYKSPGWVLRNHGEYLAGNESAFTGDIDPYTVYDTVRERAVESNWSASGARSATMVLNEHEKNQGREPGYVVRYSRYGRQRSRHAQWADLTWDEAIELRREQANGGDRIIQVYLTAAGEEQVQKHVKVWVLPELARDVEMWHYRAERQAAGRVFVDPDTPVSVPIWREQSRYEYTSPTLRLDLDKFRFGSYIEYR